jgi:hypothetical protein
MKGSMSLSEARKRFLEEVAQWEPHNLTGIGQILDDFTSWSQTRLTFLAPKQQHQLRFADPDSGQIIWQVYPSTRANPAKFELLPRWSDEIPEDVRSGIRDMLSHTFDGLSLEENSVPKIALIDLADVVCRDTIKGQIIGLLSKD